MSSRDAVSEQTNTTVSEDKKMKHTEEQHPKERTDLEIYTLLQKIYAHKEKEGKHSDAQEKKEEKKFNVSEEKKDMSSDAPENAGKTSDGLEEDVKKSDAPEKDIQNCDAPQKDVMNCGAPWKDVNKSDVQEKDVKNYDAPEKDVKKSDAPKKNMKNCDAREKDVKKSDAPEKDVTNCDAPEEDVNKLDALDTDVTNCDAPEKEVKKSDAPEKYVKNCDAPEKDAKNCDATENDVKEPDAPEKGGSEAPEKEGQNSDALEKDGNESDASEKKGKTSDATQMGREKYEFSEKEGKKPDSPEQTKENKPDAPKKKEERTTEKAMKFDDALKKVGNFGLYQKRLLIIACLTGGCVILQNNSPVITMRTPAHRCKIPGYANDTFQIQNSFHKSLLDLNVPKEGDGKYSQCKRYDLEDDGISSGNNSKTAECTEWVYDRSTFTETLVSELNLVCDRKIYRSHSSMMIFAGKFVGAFLCSVAGDYFGRRKVYTVMLIGMLASALGLVFVDTLPVLMTLRFFIGGTTTGCYLCVYVIGMELLGMSQRSRTALIFKVCEISMSLMAVLCAYLLRDWHHYQASLAAPCVLVIVGYFFIPESPRWLMSKGRLEEAQKIMDEVARINGVHVSPRLEAESLPESVSKAGNNQEANVTVSPVQLFKVPRLAVRYTLLYFCWIFIIMCMYGLMLNVSNMSGDIFVNFALMSGVDALSMVFYAVLIERVGRRLLLVGVTGLGGLACLATILPTVLGGSTWILRVLSIVGRMGITTAISAIYVMSPELFPTVLRSFGLGSCSMFARIGGLASPYVADLNTYVHGVWGPALPQIVFGVAGVTTAGMILSLPETRGRQLPETVKDAEHFKSINSETTISKDEQA